MTNSIKGRGRRRGLGGLTCSRRWLTCLRIEPIYLSHQPVGTTGESEREGEGEVKKVVTETRDGNGGSKRKKEGKKVAEFRGVNDELLFIK